MGQERGFTCPFRQPQMCLNLPNPHPPKPAKQRASRALGRAPWAGAGGAGGEGRGQGVLPAAPRAPQLPAPEEPPPPSAQRPAPSPRRRLRSSSLSPGSSRPPGGPRFSDGAAFPVPGLAVPSVLRAAATRATWGARRPGIHHAPIPSRTRARPRRPSGRRRGPRGIEDWTGDPGQRARQRQRAAPPRRASHPRFSIRKKHAVQPREPRLRRGRVK